ncbi:MAG TPA: DUF1844 domain-containing protein [Terriglobales bacterium]|nr:DUF1844 domain-containing protein [Terriglobales bacterium]
MKEKKQEPEFIVTDRRKFTESGEPRHESEEPVQASRVPSTLEDKAAAQPSSRPDEASDPAGSSRTARVEHLRESPPVSQAEHDAQTREYDAGNKRLDEVLREKTGGRTQSMEMTFERLVASLYMTAMLQLGLMAPEGEQPRADILGARQTIDTIGILNEKTKGNLTAAEQTLLQQSLFDLRMAYLELTNAITRGPGPGAKDGPGSILGAQK